jgi:nucleotide-binding universal stress UspA family protein
MSTSLKNILLATDGSRDAEVALRAAADISEKSGAALHVIHVWTDVRPPANPGLVLDDYSRCLEKEAAKLLRQQAWKARVSGGRTVWVYLRVGEPVEEIGSLAEELDADLVVVGNRGAGRVKRLITGSVSEGVVRRASCPVLVVRGGEGAWPIERVVVGDDGSRSARQAGKLATEIADVFGAEAVLVRAYENPPAPVGGWRAEERRQLDQARLRDLSTLEGWAEQLGAMAHDRPDTKMIESKPAPAIVNVAEEAEETQTLIAVGSRGLSAPKRALLGSVSTKILRTADGPILVVPPARAQRVDRMLQGATSAQRTWRNG